MEIHGFAASPNTWVCRSLAAHLSVPLKYVPVNLLNGEQKTEAYLALNPFGRTPTLVDGDFKLSESTAILHYIASKSPGPISPEDPQTRADIIRWHSWKLAHWGSDACVPLTWQNFVKQLFGMGAADDAVVAKALDVFAKEAAVLDRHLEAREWLVGDNLTIADFSVAAPLFYANEAKIPVGEFENVSAWFARVSALPCWAETASEMPTAA